MRKLAAVVLVLGFSGWMGGGTGVGWGQSPRPVLRPPRPGEGSFTPASAAAYLQSTLMGLGRVSYQLTTTDKKTNAVTGPVEQWERVTDLYVNAQRCEMRIAWDTPQGEQRSSHFLEVLTHPDVLRSADYLDAGQPALSHVVSPTVYSVRMGEVGDFKVPSEGTARRVAAALTTVVDSCKHVARSATAGAPSLEDTLNFIADRLNQQGTVSWMATFQNTTSGQQGQPVQMSTTINGAAAHAEACIVSLHDKLVAGGNTRADFDTMLSLRRLDNAQVLPIEQDIAAQYAKQGHPEQREAVAQPVSVVVLNFSNGETFRINCADESIADRFAKAFVHAAEICGTDYKAAF